VSVLRHLAEKPWLTPQSATGDLVSVGQLRPPIGRLGLWVFLSVVTILFLLLIVSYASRMALEDWRPGPELGLLWLNTLALLCSSIAMQRAAVTVRRGRIDDARPALLAGGLFAVAFLLGQVLAWLQLRSMGALGVTIPSVAFFYLITGLHALHVAGGLVAWGRTAARLWSEGDAAQARQGIELCTIYWHFLLVVWLVLLALLFSGNNMSAVLAFCGLR
jgi:cytochrome c oxidase subunit III